ncbi:Carbonic anhydrase 2 [Colletotrichum chlorophyti]|uniref:Carbonic anhydrase n=1 Tax=Colletotrichum chlorophyti TaxID=708187 RepID=A0A1Q8S005_9PEZI|nr:Carbonic anhydrase 2 [Colletotrichum chlorophyti]
MKPSHLLPLASLATAICHHRTSLYARSGAGTLATRDGGVEVAKFGYDDLAGPLNWHGLNNQSSKCATGTQQSPINLNDTSAVLVPGSSLGFDVPNFPHGAEFENLGSTLEVVAQNGTLARRGRKFHLRQFHFHTPSEHRVDSEYYPMEVHFVFEADAEQLKNSTGPSHSVLGFLIEVDNSAPSPLLSNVFAHLDEVAEPGSHAETDKLNFCELKALLARSDGIAWNVVAEPLLIDDVTFRAAKKIMKFNARYTQNVPGQRNLLDHSRVVLNSLNP